MVESGRSTGLAGVIFTFVFVSLLLGACGQVEISAVPAAQKSLTVTSNTSTKITSSTIPQTTQAIQTPPSPQSTAPVYSGLEKGKLKEMYQVLTGLADAKSFKIYDDWSGLSTGSPSQDHFTISRKANQFEGEGVYSEGGYNWVENDYNSYLEASVAITIPLEVGHKFLQMLADAPVEEGPSKSTMTAGVDNYPSFYMSIETGYGPLEFFSFSDCCYIRTFTFAGHTFEGSDTSAFDAFALLKPFLHYEAQKNLQKPSASPKNPDTKTTTPGVTLPITKK